MIARATRAARGPLPAALVFALALTAALLEAFVLLRERETWTQSQLGAVQWHALGALLLAPLGAAVAAIEAAAVGGSLLGTLAAVQRRAARTVLRAGTRVAGLLGAVHVAGLAAVLAVVRGRGLEGGLPVAAALPGFAALLAGALIGAAIGWRMRRPIAAPVAALVVFALLGIAADAFAEVLYVPGAADAVGLIVNSGGVLASLAAFALLCAAAVGTAVARSPWARGASIVALVGLVALVVTGPNERTREDKGAVLCEGRAPIVCAYPERRSWLPASQHTVARLQRALAELAPGLPPPDRYSEAAKSSSRSIMTLQVADPEDRAALSQDVADVLVRCSDDAVEGYVALELARKSFDPADVPAPATLGLMQPAPLLREQRVHREALREIRRTRGEWC